MGLDNIDTCANCGKKEGEGGTNLKRCMACKYTYYCGAECQKANWKKHKKSCEYLQMPTIDRAYAGEEGSEPAVIPGMGGMECSTCARNGVACSCSSEPMSLWRPQGGARTFIGTVMVKTPTGAAMFKKLDDPKDFPVNLPSLPGHYQTIWENMSELNHCDDSEGDFLKEMKARDISKYLVDYRGHKKESGKEDESMYPFHENLVSFSPYTGSPAPKVRADDIIEATVAKDMSVFGFPVKKGTALHVYVVSLTSAGVVTGIVQTNRNKMWVYFPIHHAKLLVVRGKNWKK